MDGRLCIITLVLLIGTCTFDAMVGFAYFGMAFTSFCADCESVDHLFRHCQPVKPIWHFFFHLFGLHELPLSMEEVWGSWRFKFRPVKRILGGVIVKAIVWYIWLTRNDCIFNATALSSHSVILKVTHVLISWFSAVPIS